MESIKKEHKGHVIIAPHPDDEIIGCYEILVKENPVIIYVGDIENERREEALKLKNYTNISMQLFLNSVPPPFLNDKVTLYFPDPSTETHPKHRMWGAIGEQILRQGINVIFYTINMNVPYIHNVKEWKKKLELLDKVYPSQKDLWKFDKKYVLFEGRNKWIL